MKIVLATGIFPPEIGGPATYVERLAAVLRARGMTVNVIAYGSRDEDDGSVRRVSRSGGPLLRWRRYARALKETASDADIVCAFSSVSVGVPLWLANLRRPQKILRLGGDFLWERRTDRGGTESLKDWYAGDPAFKGAMSGLLRRFDHIVFSTRFQEELYEKSHAQLPLHGVIENALPEGAPVRHALHEPMKLLFMGRFVSFKNIGSLVIALTQSPGMTLTLVGEGPLEGPLRTLVAKHGLTDRVTFVASVSGDAKRAVLLEHDLLVLPSYTEISPNVALEARAAGLPTLLTAETGLSTALTDGAMLRPLRSPQDIALALAEAKNGYDALAERASAPAVRRTWDDVADEHIELFRRLL